MRWQQHSYSPLYPFLSPFISCVVLICSCRSVTPLNGMTVDSPLRGMSPVRSPPPNRNPNPSPNPNSNPKPFLPAGPIAYSVSLNARVERTQYCLSSHQPSYFASFTCRLHTDIGSAPQSPRSTQLASERGRPRPRH
jgi:hypothetical protein